jgi:hypothetical protein
MKTMHDMGPPDFFLHGIINRTLERINKVFNEEPSIAKIGAKSRKLTIFICGYSRNQHGIFLEYGFLSNWESIENNENGSMRFVQNDIARNEFSCFSLCLKDGKNFELLIFGDKRKITPTKLLILRTFAKNASPRAAVKRLVHFIQQNATDGGINTTIGKQISSKIIYPDFEINVQCDYHTSKSKNVVHMGAGVWAFPDTRLVLADAKLEKAGNDARPMVVTEVSRRAPCPCGSGKRYKSCHGKKYKRRQ